MPDAAGAAAVLVSEALVSAALGGGALSCGLHAASPAATPAPARPPAAARLKNVLRSESIGESESRGALLSSMVSSIHTVSKGIPPREAARRCGHRRGKQAARTLRTAFSCNVRFV